MNIAIILSGGVGTRMGVNIPKQYIEVGGKPIITYALERFIQRDDIDLVIIGVAEEWKSFVEKHLPQTKTHILFSPAGETRQYSIYNALKVAKESGCQADDIVIIHDAARPLVTNQIITDCIEGVKEGYDGVLPVLPVKDTIYLSDGNQSIAQLLDRKRLCAGQAPESFRLGAYLSLHEKMSREELLKINGSTELAFKAGQRIKIVDGDEMNFKITTPEDLNRFKQIVQHK